MAKTRKTIPGKAYTTDIRGDTGQAPARGYGHGFPGQISSADVNAITPNGVTRDCGQRSDAPGRCTVRDGVFTYEPPKPWAGNRSGEGG